MADGESGCVDVVRELGMFSKGELRNELGELVSLLKGN
jgi:hypothetical protein